MMKKILGLDIGGTSIKAGLVHGCNMENMVTAATPARGTEIEVLEAIEKVVAEFVPFGFEAIGVGVPSVVNVEKGIVYDVTNIPAWKEVLLRDFLESNFKVPVYVNNDANCFAAGEKHFGKGKQVKSLIGVTLGTGLGAGLVFNNHLYEGRNCGAGEIANLPYLAHNYEYYCSGQFFKDELKVPAHEVFQLASEGDVQALKHFETFGSHLGKFLQAVLYAYDPQLIVMGGSVSQAYKFFSENMFRSLSEGFIFPNSLENIKIEISELENVAIYGAASLVLEKN